MKEDKIVEAKLPPVEEYNEIRTFDISSLPHKAVGLNIKNCVSAELVRAVIPRGEYTIDATENTFTVSSGVKSSDLTIPVGDYTITELAAAIQLAVTSSGTDIFSNAALFTCSYNSLKSTITMAHSTPEEFTIDFTEPQLAYSLGFASVPPPEPTGGAIAYTVVGPNGSLTMTTPIQGVALADVASAIQSDVRSTGTSVFADASLFTVAVATTGTKLAFAHSTPEAHVFTFGSSQLAKSMQLNYTTAVSGSGTVTGTNRVDLFGNRTVQVKTTELGPEHHEDIMQSIHVSDEMTFWENTLDPRLSERRFRHPRLISELNFSILTRHPHSRSKDDYTQLNLNGVMAHLTVCFRCLRYSNKEIADQALELS